jgi:hypothetical protein
LNLSHILQPLAVSQFLVEYFGIGPLHIPGPARRFETLAPAPPDHPCLPAADLARNLERDLEAPVRAEPHADWSGLAMHRAERDMLVLQIAGQDLWNIHGRDHNLEAAEPTAEPEPGRLLEAGGALYIPRGWWCAALPQSAPSLNWIFSIHNPTGAELLVWLAGKLKDHDIFQADIPRFAGPAAQAAYLAALRKTMSRAFRTPSLLERYSWRLNRLAPAHPISGTPWSEDLSGGHFIAWAAPRYPRIQRLDRETIYLTVHDQDFRFPLDAAPLLQYLLDKAPAPLCEFYRGFEGEFDRDELSSFLSALSRDGIIALLQPEPVELEN